MSGKKSLKKRLLLVLLSMVLSVGMFFVPFPGTQQVSTVLANGDDDNPDEYTYYTLASVAASAFSNAAFSKEGQSISSVFGSIPSNAAGGLLGFCDESKTRGIHILQLLTSLSTAEYSYKQLIPVETSSPFKVGSNAVFAPYVVLGAVLSDLGLDATGAGFGGFTFMRAFAGYLMLVVYTMSLAVPLVFQAIIQFMQDINPFQAFRLSGFSWTNGIGIGSQANLDEATGMATAGAQYSNTGPFAAITDIVSRWYRMIYPFALIILAVMLAYVVFQTVIKPANKRSWQPWKRYLLRVGFLVLGVPVCGGMYTTFLAFCGNMVGSSNSAAARVIASTFCDFEAFVDHGMNFRSQLWFDYDKSGNITASNQMNAQTVCMQINASSVEVSEVAGWSAIYGGNSGDVTGGIGSMVDDMQNSRSSSVNGGSESLNQWVISLLNRYANASKVTATSYASTQIADTWGKQVGTINQDLAEFIESHDGMRDYDNNGGAVLTSGDGLPVSDNPFYGTGGPAAMNVGPGRTNAQIAYTDWRPSKMSVYNYLNTSFGPNKMTVYSSEKASSEAIREHHYAVNMAGSGPQSFLIYLTTILLLLVDTVIGLGYALPMFFRNLFRGIRTILSVFPAMMGNLTAVARVVTYTVVMALEILGTCAAYALITEMLYTIASAFLGAFVTVAAGSAAMSVGLVLAFGPMIGAILTILFLLFFLYQALKFRASVVKSLETMAENVISKFIIGTDANGNAIATGALAPKDRSSGGFSTMGVAPERNMLQRGVDVAAGMAGAAVHGVAAVTMAQSGNLAGAAMMAQRAVSDAGYAADSTKAETGYAGKAAGEGAGTGGISQSRAFQNASRLAGAAAVMNPDMAEKMGFAVVKPEEEKPAEQAGGQIEGGGVSGRLGVDENSRDSLEGPDTPAIGGPAPDGPKGPKSPGGGSGAVITVDEDGNVVEVTQEDHVETRQVTAADGAAGANAAADAVGSTPKKRFTRTVSAVTTEEVSDGDADGGLKTVRTPSVAEQAADMIASTDDEGIRQSSLKGSAGGKQPASGGTVSEDSTVIKENHVNVQNRNIVKETGDRAPQIGKSAADVPGSTSTSAEVEQRTEANVRRQSSARVTGNGDVRMPGASSGHVPASEQRSTDTFRTNTQTVHEGSQIRRTSDGDRTEGQGNTSRTPQPAGTSRTVTQTDHVQVDHRTQYFGSSSGSGNLPNSGGGTRSVQNIRSESLVNETVNEQHRTNRTGSVERPRKRFRPNTDRTGGPNDTL